MKHQTLTHIAQLAGLAVYLCIGLCLEAFENPLLKRIGTFLTRPFLGGLFYWRHEAHGGGSPKQPGRCYHLNVENGHCLSCSATSH